ncbi:Alpha/beta hydrolase [Streptomyces sp. BpilaLS-43]|uniref:alpha/beta hydrolase n=1 Tax=Streptomyces sp. BpilaLS-43 TaxID=1839778 RepID=UPI00081BAF5C|nr:alpha/beta hydrolase [Streptomyces sp. BpilaLS-43]SCD90939.1 Alpha/beta hydrolase [Streptomyces sp. BpilaLS-43]
MTTGTAALSWAALRDLRCAELESAADGWGRVGNRADAARDRIDKHLLNGLRETQQGAAAESAAARLRRLNRNFQYVHTECGLIRTTLNSLAHEMKAQQRALMLALEDAAALKFTVQADGSVSYPAAGEGMIDGRPLQGGTTTSNGLPDLVPPSGLAAPNPNVAKAQDIADRVVGAVRAAAEIDWRYAGILRRLKAEEGLAVPTSTWKDAASDAADVRDAARTYLRDAIPRTASPAERNAWWAGLTQEQREEYLAVYPDVIGNLDGIPAAVRDAANRDNLQLLIGTLAGRDDADSVAKLAGLREIDRQLQAGTDPPMFLLGIGEEGNGRAIVSYGDPDTARNVAAYVPGLNTSLDKEFAEGDLKRAWDTAKGAQKYDHSSAVMVWLGYDAPQFPDGWSSADVMGDERAKVGGQAFGSFMDGLGVTNMNDDPHLTAIGHSYGSRTVGAAAQDRGGVPGVDEIVFVGSPGVGVDRADELGVGKGHVFVGAAQNDVVTKVPSRLQGGLTAAAGPVGYAIGGLLDREKDDLWFGKDPASSAFGARRFHADDGPHLISGSFAAHSQYFDAQPQRSNGSADSIAMIVAGCSDAVKLEELR